MDNRMAEETMNSLEDYPKEASKYRISKEDGRRQGRGRTRKCAD